MSMERRRKPVCSTCKIIALVLVCVSLVGALAFCRNTYYYYYAAASVKLLPPANPGSILSQERTHTDSDNEFVSSSNSTSASETRQGHSRNVYLDIGANWGNTLRLYLDIDNKAGPWEVYSFELSPSTAYYVDKLASFLNGELPKPDLTVLPIGYTPDAKRYVKRYGCERKTFQEAQHCLAHLFCKPCNNLPFDRRLSSPSTISARLAEASRPARSKDRFTFFNGAVGRPRKYYFGTANSNCTAKPFCPGLPMVGPDFLDAIEVQTIDVPLWLTQNFHERDHIVIKCDAESGEYGFLEGIIKLKAGRLIDTLAIECHRTPEFFISYCNKLISQVKEVNPKMKVLKEKVGYKGWDSAFDPDVFYPVNPSQE